MLVNAFKFAIQFERTFKIEQYGVDEKDWVVVVNHCKKVKHSTD